MNKAYELLVKFNDSIKLLNLDIGGKHSYMLGHRSNAIITEIRQYLSRKVGPYMNIYKIEEGTTIEFKKEPLPGRGLLFTYDGSFEIDGKTMHRIKSGVFVFNITDDKLKECL